MIEKNQPALRDSRIAPLSAFTLNDDQCRTAMARKVNTTEAPLIFIVEDDISVRRDAYS